MRSTTLWARLLGLVHVVVEGVEFDEAEEAIVVSVRPRKTTKRRCGRCGRRCPGYDRGEGRRRWRALDLGTVRAFVEADILRKKPNIKWTKDRGKEPEREKADYPWFWSGGEFVGDRINDVHLANAEKQAARQ